MPTRRGIRGNATGRGRWLLAALSLLLWGTALAGTKHYYYTDPQGTVLAKADAQGNIVERYEYTPYGVPVPSVGAAPNGQGYTGHVNDPETGLVYMQARYYDPAVGRFLSVDPVTAAENPAAAFNRYWYANNNPIRFTDPDGRCPVCVLVFVGVSLFTASDYANAPGPKDTPVSMSTGERLTEVAGALPSNRAISSLRTVINVNNRVSDASNPAKSGGKLPKPPMGPGTAPKNERDPKRFFTPSEREAKRSEQGHQCGNGCGKQVDESNSAGHHIERHADGGRSTPENHAEVCIDCHKELHSGD